MAWSEAARRAAAEARKRGVRLFHGTHSGVAKVSPRSTRRVDPKEVYLTTSPKAARDYAEMRASEHGTKPVVFAARSALLKDLRLAHSTLRSGDYYTTSSALGAKNSVRLNLKVKKR